MTGGAAPDPAMQPEPVPSHPTFRRVLWVLAVAWLVAWLVPPLATLARRWEFAEALQFAAFGVGVPALLVTGAPWRLLGLAAATPLRYDDDGNEVAGSGGAAFLDRLARSRRHHPEPWRSGLFVGPYLAAIIIWRTPLGVNGIARHPWLIVLEAAVLVATGIGAWFELVESPPLSPRLPRPYRVALAAVTMWTIWILAYLVGLSHASWYRDYLHHAGGGLSLSADQQLTTGLLWFVSACVSSAPCAPGGKM